MKSLFYLSEEDANSSSSEIVDPLSTFAPSTYNECVALTDNEDYQSYLTWVHSSIQDTVDDYLGIVSNLIALIRVTLTYQIDI